VDVMKTSEKNFDEDCDLVRSTCLTEFRCDAATVVFVGGLKEGLAKFRDEEIQNRSTNRWVWIGRRVISPAE
jgi:hypothetical protein